MRLRLPKHWGWILTGIIVAGIIVWSLLPTSKHLDVVHVQRADLHETCDAEGVTEYVVRYMVDLPVTGSISAPSVSVGDTVQSGQVLCYYQAPVLDDRQRSSALAQAEAAAALEREAKERLEAMKPMLDQAERRAGRTARLYAEGAIAKEEAQVAQDALAQLRAEAEAAKAHVVMTAHQARAARSAASVVPGRQMAITAPSDGVVLRVFQEQSRVLMAGTPILEIGDPARIDVVIDALSIDAVRVRIGMDVYITGWGGADTLRAQVRRIEPSAHRKISTLGVEEQRVNIIASLVNPPASLGDGYKVDAAIVTWSAASVTVVPVSALVKSQGRWHVYVVSDQRARRRRVSVGHRSPTQVEVRSGLRHGESVVLHPPEGLQEGDRVDATVVRAKK